MPVGRLKSVLIIRQLAAVLRLTRGRRPRRATITARWVGGPEPGGVFPAALTGGRAAGANARNSRNPCRPPGDYL
jgi:hypothetical protein